MWCSAKSPRLSAWKHRWLHAPVMHTSERRWWATGKEERGERRTKGEEGRGGLEEKTLAHMPLYLSHREHRRELYEARVARARQIERVVWSSLQGDWSKPAWIWCDPANKMTHMLAGLDLARGWATQPIMPITSPKFTKHGYISFL